MPPEWIMGSHSSRFALSAFFERWVTQIAYPARCPVCGAVMDHGRTAWCAACDSLLGRVSGPFCPICRRFFSGVDADCPSSHSAVFPRAVHALGVFDQAWRSVIHAFKYQGYKALAWPLGALLAESVARHPGPQAIIAVPTDNLKRRERGFGHAELLARAVAQQTGIPCVSDGLRHTRRIPDQTRLTGPRRMANLKGAFAVSDASSVDGKTILVVDDVMTTGATLREAARAIASAGAKSVVGAVVAINLGALADGK